MRAKPISRNKVDILSEVRQVFEIEAAALRSAAANLSEEVRTAVQMIAKSKGRVIVTGIGKSGIVANKIAATLTSTGTPAVFLHAAEALHGDLGVIRPGDIVMAVGKSGESSELNTLLPIVRRMGARVIAITGNPESKMAAAADVVLALVFPREACPLNLAPTCSTTASLVLGDAIAVALMKVKNVSSDDFAMRHPGGQLGKRLLLEVSDIMRTGERNPVIHVGDTVKKMLFLITQGQAGAISVVDDVNGLVGLVSDYDIRIALDKDTSIFDLRIEDIMNRNPTFVYADQKATVALETMRARRKPTAVLPVLDAEKKVVGMIHVMDLVSAGL